MINPINLALLSILIILFLETLNQWPSYPVVFDISRFGAFPDGRDCTAIIQECVDTLPEGGQVYAPAGDYRINGATYMWRPIGDPIKFEESTYAGNSAKKAV